MHNKKPVYLLPDIRKDMDFLVTQLQLIEHAQDDKKIAQVAWKYGIYHYLHDVPSWKPEK